MQTSAVPVDWTRHLRAGAVCVRLLHLYSVYRLGHLKLQFGPLRVCIWMVVVWVVPGLCWVLTGLFGDSN